MDGRRWRDISDCGRDQGMANTGKISMRGGPCPARPKSRTIEVSPLWPGSAGGAEEPEPLVRWQRPLTEGRTRSQRALSRPLRA